MLFWRRSSFFGKDYCKRLLCTQIGNRINKDKRQLMNVRFMDLINSYHHHGTMILRSDNIHHVNPHNGIVLPYDYYTTKNCNFRGIYGTYGYKAFFDFPPFYNRTNVSIPDVDIVLNDIGEVVIHGVRLRRIVNVVEKVKLKKYICQLWKKGYFLSIPGLVYHNETGHVLKQHIYLPDWFTLSNSTEHNLFKFIENLLI